MLCGRVLELQRVGAAAHLAVAVAVDRFTQPLDLGFGREASLALGAEGSDVVGVRDVGASLRVLA